ncbi:FAD-binding and (Fe-S)-binding domain-containing protein [Arcticibacter eurypsychrophilus]|uniref:FAD-binding and (Fe-S)-binding domain-containing protein n=1 Tax=Arcticibacter eurypsychrophilus TaxID=1434752 RepID=UPI00084CFA1C|nr:FAD-binding and (Fe-S)-binding domain-containing protein [Arcticibacter eurypsychrophilus]
MVSKTDKITLNKLEQLRAELDGELYLDTLQRILYATDASSYREIPLAVAVPKTVDDIKALVRFANREKTSLVPRCAGTSLAGQVVGEGIIVDLSKYFTEIIAFNREEKWVRVQPGVIRDVLNMFLKPFGLFFAPETSTANRAMIGGMVGNNSCGANSIVYGSTREHLLEVNAVLSDGSEVVFKALDLEAFYKKCIGSSLESTLYHTTLSLLSDPATRSEIEKEFPKKSIRRRNTGYALDLLMDANPFSEGAESFNFCKLVAGSEGTLAFVTEIKLNLVALPDKHKGLLCVHFNTVEEALRANSIAMSYQPSACELMDHYILDCTRDNIEQRKNRFFILGEPGAILMVEFIRGKTESIVEIAGLLAEELQRTGLGYHYPLILNEECNRIWDLRKAGLGLLSNLPGDDKAVPVIEDTAVDLQDLTAYISEFNEILKKHDLYSVHYAHAGAGELHLRPIINLKTSDGNAQYKMIAAEIAELVKRYRGSLSGEHGDGRLRGEFLPFMFGEKNYQLFKTVKDTWDPKRIFNPGKIVETPPMNTMLRYEPGQQQPEIKTVFRFNGQTVLQHAEQCNGSGDCRKLQFSGGTMCPSYMATRNEKETTRGRANTLREFLTHSEKINRFDHKEILEVMDLCLSCKGCKSECPSSVDLAKLKAEFLQHYYDANGAPFRSRIIARFSTISGIGALLPSLYNFMASTGLPGMAGFAKERALPKLYSFTLKSWYKKRGMSKNVNKKQVYLFFDEFSNYIDTSIGIKAILLLEHLGFDVLMPQHIESGRTWLSKGFVRKAKKIANQNVSQLGTLITSEIPLIGLEPSAILTFRDEYPDLVDDDLLDTARRLALNTFLIDEFLAQEAEKGTIGKELFIKDSRKVLLHGHCQQKAVSSVAATVRCLSLPENYLVETIPSGCCGMAGSFGLEQEHYKISMQIGELILLPAVREAPDETLIAATGTSCRHQIKDGTGRDAFHTVEILYDALLNKGVL